MKCLRCGNEDPSFFYHGSKGWYCRKCIAFGRALLEEDEQVVSIASSPIRDGSEEYTLAYPLTQKQKEIGHLASETVKEKDVLIQAVCGAGKTEMTVETIARILSEKKRICFAIARRQVVLELAERLSSIFPHAKVTAVCGGHTSELEGDLIVCTTHQLYRWTGRGGEKFDVVILDEPDAFPFKGDPVLHGIAENACKGHRIFLTATPDESILEGVKQGTIACYTLNRRPHGHDLPVPRIRILPFPCRVIALLLWIHRNKEHPRMIFFPAIAEAYSMHAFLKLFFPVYLCTSKTENRDEVIASFKKEKAGIIAATTVLERGVTVPGADICVFDADNGVFDEAGLVQMAGRAGRSFSRPYGDVLFLLGKKSSLCIRCRDAIMEANKCSA